MAVSSVDEAAVVVVKDEEMLQPDDTSPLGDSASLADRVKKRRRITVAVAKRS
jgi:hypothetical protein